MTDAKPPRRIDRNRRERIIVAAIGVMEEEGVHALTHRRAARAAGVPLAATTYYFDSLGDLLSAALQQVVDRHLVATRERLESRPPDESMAEFVARYICESSTVDKPSAVMTTEFWAAALRHPEVREVALGWYGAELDMLTPILGRPAARAALAAMAGLSQLALVTGEPPSFPDMTEVMRQILPDVPSDAPAADVVATHDA